MENQTKTIEQAITEAVKAAIAGSLTVQAEKEVTKGERIRGIRELAAYLNCSTATAQGLKNRNEVPYYQLKSRVFFYANEVDSALKKGGQK